MWALFKERLNLSDAELQKALAAAKPPPQLINCSVCRNSLQSTARRCLYCGTTLQVEVKTIELQAQRSRTRLTQQ